MRSLRLLVLFSLATSLMTSCGSDGSRSQEADVRWWTKEDQQLILNELIRTTEELNIEINDLYQKQWNFKEDTSRWSIGEIVEHLEMQNQLHYREITTTARGPHYLQYRAITKGKDSHFSDYGTDPTLGTANWFLEPLGRFSTRKLGEYAFNRARSQLLKFVKETQIDLRKQFTFRIPVQGRSVESIKVGEVRDLHQLLLTGIAHTDRHLSQIRKLKTHEGYPN